MSRKLIDGFYWSDFEEQNSGEMTDTGKYKRIVSWAAKARGHNPNAFDALTEWILDDSQWNDEKLTENEQILMQGVIARFKEQNAQLRMYLSDMEPSGAVNAAVYKALDRFDDELSGLVHEGTEEAVARVFADFSAMRERAYGNLLPEQKQVYGYCSVDLFGYINCLKDCECGVQWHCSMPDLLRGSKRVSKWTALNTKKCLPCALSGVKAMIWTIWRYARSFSAFWTI